MLEILFGVLNSEDGRDVALDLEEDKATFLTGGVLARAHSGVVGL